MLDRIGGVISAIASACLAAMAVFTMADAIGRYFFNAPFAGSIEYISYMLAFLIVPAYALVTRERGHITVGVLSEILPKGYGRVERVFSDLVTIGGCAVVLLLIVEQAMSYARSGRTGEATGISLASLAYGLAFFAAIALVFSITLLFRRNARPENTKE